MPHAEHLALVCKILWCGHGILTILVKKGFLFADHESWTFIIDSQPLVPLTEIE